MEKRRADGIAIELQELIFNGTFKNGDRLDETRLADRFGVSRTPLREAFQRLTLSGLVELIPRRGAFVRQPGPVELVQMFELMAELEAACGRFAATRISDGALNELGAVNRRCEQAISDNDPDGYYDLNEVFHQTIYDEAGNQFLADEAARLHERLKPFRRRQLRLRGRMAQSMSEHRRIVDALTNAQATEAADALREHVSVQGEKFHALMANVRDLAA